MNGNRTVTILNHGCKLNQFEGESIEYSFERAGYRIVDIHDDVRHDVIIVNTCTVTSRSDRKSRNTIMHAARSLSENGLLIVTGCYAQTNPRDLKDLQRVNLIVGSDAKASIPEIVESHFKGRVGSSFRSKGHFDYPVPEKPHRSRVFLKIQDGCNMHCAYCRVPFARGRSHSREAESIIREINRIHENGYNEVVLTGVNIGSYDQLGEGLSGLLALLLRETSNTLRIRLSSVEPDCIDNSLLEIIEHERIMPHFHVPLQSGSDRILKYMNRPYSVAEYLAIIERIRQVKPHCHLASDLIVGFPGEGDDDFRKTLRVVENARFASLHVFRFSPRDGTAAALLSDHVPHVEKTRRSRELIELGKRLNLLFRKRFEGTVRDAVFEPKFPGFVGITDNYIRVKVDAPGRDITRALLPIKILSACEKETVGKLVGS